MIIVRARKKPVVISAVHLTEDVDWEAIAEWCGGEIRNLMPSAPGMEPRSVIVIGTLEGDMFAEEGDWILQGTFGEFYPVKPSIFAKTHDVLSDEEPELTLPEWLRRAAVALALELPAVVYDDVAPKLREAAALIEELEGDPKDAA